MQKKPVILIPGIQGTKLLDANQADFITVWSGIKKFFSNIHQLALRKNGINAVSYTHLTLPTIYSV